MVCLYMCLFIQISHMSSTECLTLPAWGESPIGVGPSPQVKWRGETGSECCAVKVLSGALAVPSLLLPEAQPSDALKGRGKGRRGHRRPRQTRLTHSW